MISTHTTRTGLRIGIAHIPKPLQSYNMSADVLKLQAALLEQRTRHPQTRLQRFIGSIYRWL